MVPAHIVLVANGFTHRAEHSYRLIQEVRGAAAGSGIECQVYAPRCLDPAIAKEEAAIPHFRDTLYDSVGRHPSHPLIRKFGRILPGASQIADRAVEFLTWKSLNRSLFHDLRSLPPEHRAKDCLLVMTALSQNQISGVVEFLRALPESEMPTVACQLMFPPSWTPWGRLARSGDDYYRCGFQSAAPFIGRKLFFTTENEAIAEIYREKFGVETTILPIPFRSSRRRHRANKRPRLGFFGYSKTAKGFHLLPEIARLSRAKGLDVTYVVQIYHSGWETEVLAAEQALRQLDNVHIVEGALTSEDYAAELSAADAVLLPYHPALFGMQGSGVFTECLTSGCPIVASEGTFAAKAIAKDEAQGEIFAPFTPSACVSAIERLIPRLKECAARAAAHADVAARRHSGEAYLNALLRLGQTEAPYEHSEL